MLLRPRSTVLFQEVAEGAVLFSVADEVYFGLNETAAALWRALAESPADVVVLARRLADRYPDEPADRIEAHVRELLDDLAANGLLEPVGVASLPVGASAAAA